jgi:hypothetical protein
LQLLDSRLGHILGRCDGLQLALDSAQGVVEGGALVLLPLQVRHQLLEVATVGLWQTHTEEGHVWSAGQSRMAAWLT